MSPVPAIPRPTPPDEPSAVPLPEWVRHFTWFPRLDRRLDEPTDSPDVTFGPREGPAPTPNMEACP